MINLLFLLATAHAADVYDLCVIKRQRWSDRYQHFKTEQVETFYTYERPRLIIYEDSFEIDRDSHPIIEKTSKGKGKTCWREHKNSELCYNEEYNLILWEWNTRAGATLRDLFVICKINGE